MRARTTFDPALSRRGALRLTAEVLDAPGIAATDARFLVLGVLDLRAIDLALHGDRPIGPEGAAGLNDAVRRRLSGEPVARILGAWEFWGLPFRLSPETLVPRPDTETVVEAALRTIPDHAARMRVLDLGTGSGCILVALLSELPHAAGVGLDRSVGALRTARANAVRNGVGTRAAFVAADWCDALAGRFDLVVSNPPYIAAAALPGLEREVRDHDPASALDGGRDGLDAYRRILDGVSRSRLAEAGTLVLEVGFDQTEAVIAAGKAAGFALRDVARDLAGHARVVVFAGRNAVPGVSERPRSRKSGENSA
ncbi:peptide chain release factor N(5)-glutamine methyltransferase [uncultured Methylobacterium sp.]|uniref:peptide chain release factor N(5)-glutamine methyltransferase n=1 Tax=uncultured Methylobacterium sp. TaxID=157278 RepID=UPI0035CB0FED